MDLARWLSSISHSDRPLLIASDFDGTLSNITSDPGDAFMREGARAVLQHMAWAPRVHLALISGRSINDLRARCRLQGPLWFAGEHGAELLSPAGALMTVTGENTHSIANLSRAAEIIAGSYPRAMLEIKANSVSFHVRNVEQSLQLQAAEAFGQLAEDLGAITLNGRKVIEASFSPADKGAALKRIRAEIGGDPLTVYAGDDETDVPALRYVAGLNDGLALFIRSPERASPGCLVNGILADPLEWVWTLNEIARVLS